MFCAPGLVFGGVECVGSRFHVLCARTPFRQYRGRRVPFSCFALPDSFSALPRASGLIFMFYATELGVIILIRSKLCVVLMQKMLGVIILIFTKLYVVMRPTIFKKSINLFKQLFSLHLIYVLCKICSVQCSYQSVNWIIF
jgi:hypothetical protein